MGLNFKLGFSKKSFINNYMSAWLPGPDKKDICLVCQHKKYACHLA